MADIFTRFEPNLDFLDIFLPSVPKAKFHGNPSIGATLINMARGDSLT
jgi:hypothetical protein